METLESLHVDALERGAVECVEAVLRLVGGVCGGRGQRVLVCL